MAIIEATANVGSLPCCIDGAIDKGKDTMNKRFQNSQYSSFVLRIWQDELTQETRATLRNAATGQQQHFSSLRTLMSHLLSEATKINSGDNHRHDQ